MTTRLYRTEIRFDGDARGSVRAASLSTAAMRKYKREQNRAADAGRRFTKTQDDVALGLRRNNRVIGDSTNLIKGYVSAFAVIQTLQLSDQYDDLNARLRVVTDTTEEYITAQREVSKLADETFTSLRGTADLYGRLEISLDDLGVSQERILNLSRSINQAFQVSGATTQESAAAAIQLAQGLAAGALRGDEFRSVSEQGTRVLKALRDGLGKTQGELREMANAGELTSEVVLTALETQSAAIQSEFEELPLTLARASQQFKNALVELVGQSNETFPVVRGLALGIQFLAENLGTAVIAASALAVVYKANLGPAIANLVVFYARFGAGMTAAAAQTALMSGSTLSLAAAQARLSAALLFTRNALFGMIAVARGLVVALGPVSIAFGLIAAVGGAIYSRTREIESAVPGASALADRLRDIAENYDMIGEKQAIKTQGEAQEKLNALLEEQVQLQARLAQVQSDKRTSNTGLLGFSAGFDSNFKEVTAAIEANRAATEELSTEMLRLGIVSGTTFTNLNQFLGTTRSILTSLVGDAPDFTSAILGMTTLGQAAEATAMFVERLKQANLKESIGGFADEIAKLRGELDPMVALQNDYNEAVEKYKKDFLEDGSKDVKGFRVAIQLLSKVFEKNKKELEQSTAAYRKQQEQIKKVAQAKTDLVRLNEDLIASQDPLLQIELDRNRALDEYNERLQLSGGEVTPQVIAALEQLNAGFDEQIKKLADAKKGLDVFTDSMEDLFTASEPTQEQLDQFTLNLALMTEQLGVSNPLVAQYAAALDRLLGRMAATLDGQKALKDEMTEFGAGVIGDLISGLNRGEDAALSFADAFATVGTVLRELEDSGRIGEEFAEIGEGLQGVALGLQAGAQGGNAFANAASAALQTFASTGGNYYAAAAAALVGFFSTPEDEDPRISLVANQVSPGSQYYSPYSQVSPLGFTTQGQQIVEGTDARAILEAVGSFDQTIASIPGLLDQFGDSIRDAFLGSAGESSRLFEGDEVDPRLILQDRFDTILSALSAPIRDAVQELGGTLESQIENLAAANQISQDVGRGTDIFAGELSVADALSSVIDLRLSHESLGDAYARLITTTYNMEIALGLLENGLSIGRQSLVELGSEVAQILGGPDRAAALFNDVFTRLFSPEEILESQLIGARGRSTNLLSELGLDPDVGLDAFKELFKEALGSGDADLIAQFVEAGSALGIVLDLEGQLADIRAATAGDLEAELEARLRLAEILSDVDSTIDELTLTDFQLGVKELARNLREMQNAADAAGASAEEYARINVAAALQFQRLVDELLLDTQDIAAQLFGTPLDQIEEQIRAIESSQGSISSVSEELDRTFEQWEDGLKRIQDFLDDLLLDDTLSPLTPSERLAEARRQFETTLTGAQGGDLDALNSLSETARAYLDEATTFFPRAGGDFGNIFETVTNALRNLGIPDGVSPAGTNTGPRLDIDYGQLASLISQRDALQAEQRERDDQRLFGTLFQNIRDLVTATGNPLEQIFGQLGINPFELVDRLGIDPLDAGSNSALADLANNLGVEFQDIGSLLALVFGEITDPDSRSNNALESTIDTLPPGIRDQLGPLLEDIENATNETDSRNAIAALETAVVSLPPDIQALLAPFLPNVDVGSPVDAELNELKGIRENSAAMLGNLQNIGSVLGATVVGSGGNKPAPNNQKKEEQANTLLASQKAVQTLLTQIKEEGLPAAEALGQEDTLVRVANATESFAGGFGFQGPLPRGGDDPFNQQLR